MSANVRYRNFAIVLHWLIAGLILLMLPLGFLMEDAPDALKLNLYQFHKTIGILILLLSLVRLGWRLINPPPKPLAGTKVWQKILSALTHWLFYAAMLVTPLLGWAMVSSSSRGTPTLLFGQINWPHLEFLQNMEKVQRKAMHEWFEEMHEVFAFVIIALFVLHVGAALKHQFIDKDDTMARIKTGGTNPLQPPPQKGRGGWVLVAGMFALFAAWVVLGASPVPANSKTAMPVVTSFESNWLVDMGDSQLKFEFEQDGQPDFGVFTDWQANIYFDRNDLAASKVMVAVNTSSAATGDTETDHSLPGSGWLDTLAFPLALWQSDSFEQTGPGQYLAKGTLTLRGIQMPLDLPFTLDITDDGQAKMDAVTSLKRLDFGIGVDDDEQAIWISNQISLRIHLTARQKPDEG